MSIFEPEIEVGVARVRAEVARLHSELSRNGLVGGAIGNVSGRVPGAELFVIRPSGVDDGELAPENMILCTLSGDVVPGTPGCERAPSRHTAAHAYVYRHMPDVGGMAHTHSTYATAWAARGEPVPCVLTDMAREFGGPIPVGPLAAVGDDSIGRGIVQTLSGHRSRAVLMRNHGPFTVGRNARAAVRTAVLVEDAARSIHFAQGEGGPKPITQTAIDALFGGNENPPQTSGGRPPTIAGLPGSPALLNHMQ
ncbi:MAG TPA: L-ribulose-5-phosphate 4-epimerase [Humibacter sp.]|nr:L-ribulose-5-phosphate 4-epimerase [Humibacter sp.]